MDGLISIIITIGIAALVSFLKDKARKQQAVPTPPMPDLFDDDKPATDSPIPFEIPPLPVAFPEKSDLPEEGGRITVDMQEENVFEKDVTVNEQIIRHREKWRQAMINAEILSPKF